ncbi:MAG: hypothetical protein K9K67_15200 [Bacteriovoracaceae bacterium]|nr:hypothetical protein [Bacteriovoracaceae bacterium]
MILIAVVMSPVQVYAQKVALLTSLDPETNRPPLRLKSWDISEKLERIFKRSFKKIKSKLSYEIVHLADANALYRTLKDPEVSALIWVGHAGFSEGDGLGQTRSIVDFKGRDLKAIFQAVGPQLKYLALVGCRGERFLNEWQEKGYFSHVPNLKTFGREVRTDARVGLKKAMKDLRELLEGYPQLFKAELTETTNYEFYQLEKSQYEKIQISRSGEGSLEAVQILQKDRLIAFFPKSETDQVKEVLIRKSDIKSDKKIVVESGLGALKTNVNLGKLEIVADVEGSWNLFQTPSGKPIGIGKNIYQYKGD